MVSGADLLVCLISNLRTACSRNMIAVKMIGLNVFLRIRYYLFSLLPDSGLVKLTMILYRYPISILKLRNTWIVAT